MPCRSPAASSPTGAPTSSRSRTPSTATSSAAAPSGVCRHRPAAVSHLYHIFNHNKRAAAINLKHAAGREALLKLVESRRRVPHQLPDRRAAAARHRRRRRARRESPTSSTRATPVAAPRVRSPRWAASTRRRSGRAPGSRWPTSTPDQGMPTADAGARVRRQPDRLRARVGCRRRAPAPRAHRRRPSSSTPRCSTPACGRCRPRSPRRRCSGVEEMRRPPRGSGAPLVNSYRTKDDRYVHLCMDQQHYWPSFCDGVGRPEWKDDPLIATHEAREANSDYCVSLIETLIAERTLVEWNEVLSGPARSRSTPCRRPASSPADPQVVANGYMAEVEDEVGRTLSLVARADSVRRRAVLDATRARLRRAHRRAPPRGRLRAWTRSFSSRSTAPSTSPGSAVIGPGRRELRPRPWSTPRRATCCRRGRVRDPIRTTGCGATYRRAAP